LEKEIGPRFAKRAKRRKVNRILNTAIAVVVLLIVVVAWNLFSGGGSDNKAADAPVKTEAKKGDNEKKVEVEIGNKQQEKESEPADENDNGDDEAKQEVIETPGAPGSNIEKEIVNPAWQPIGTTQSEPHVTQFKKDSVDWKEMLDAISYATGLSQSDMIVWFIGNNGPNKAVATISTKDKAQRYKVYIEWVENQGWKPTKVQKLKH
jgi:hypothetical protein